MTSLINTIKFIYIMARPEHIPQICEIERQCFSEPWSPESITREFTDDMARYFVAESGAHTAGQNETPGVVAGYCGYWSIAGEAHITNVAVNPNFRNRGAGAGLIGFMLGDIKALRHSAATLEVREDNYTAIRLYERFGFERAGLRRKYYDHGKKDALIMWKKII